VTASNPKTYDLAIVGGGLVGNSLACALAKSGLSIALIEVAESARSVLGFDQRKLALAQKSIEVLSSFGVIDKLQQLPTPISRIHVSRVGDFGRVMLQATDFGHQSFGSVVLAQDLGTALVESVNELENISRYCPATVCGFNEGNEFSVLNIQQSGVESAIQARFVVAADGTQSFIRNALGIKTIDHDYGQMLFVCSLEAEKANDGTAYERFTEQGPIALLPMADGLYGSICGVNSEQAAEIATLNDASYAEYIQMRFGWRVGKILRVGARSHYPIKRVLAERLNSTRTVLMGNAAQTIHPIGAQGFNLGLRDAMCFAELLNKQGLSESITSDYALQRATDRERTLAFSDGMARMTSNAGLPIHILRSVALTLLGSFPSAASRLVSNSMGFRNTQEILP
jgi:2-octaprenyl-6-methoxyphenol hydroxylase